MFKVKSFLLKVNSMKLSVCVCMLFFIAFSLRGSDWESWNDYSLNIPVSSDVSLKVTSEYRIMENFNNYYANFIDIGFDWKVGENFVFGYYTRKISSKSGDLWNGELRPHLNGTLSWELGGISLDNRSILEYRIKSSEPFFRLRDRLRLKFPEIGLLKIKPFIADEIFYDLEINEMNRNRIYAGFGFPLTEGLSAYLSYILQSDKTGSGWAGTNILDFSLKFKLK